jgi:hypothetical protein
MWHFVRNLISRTVTSIESTDYNHTSEGIERAAGDINKLFLNLTEKSCRNKKPWIDASSVTHGWFRERGTYRNQPWVTDDGVDAEIKDLRKTVTNSGIDLERNPFNLQLKTKFYKHCKDLKKIVKQKNKFFLKRTLWSTIEMERNRSQTILGSFEYS